MECVFTPHQERKERYHEIGRSDVPLEWGMSPDEVVMPAGPLLHTKSRLTENLQNL